MLQNLLDALDQQVLLFLPEDKVSFENPAARKRRTGELASPGRHPSVLKMLRDLAGGRLARPARLALSVDCASGGTARLGGLVIEGPNQRGAVLIADPDVPAASTLPLRQVIELIDAELCAPLAELAEGLAARLPAAPAPAAGEAQTPDPLDGAREFASRLDKLPALVDAFTADQIVGDDRIGLHELVAEVWRDLESTAHALRVTVSTVGLDDALPPIYGSAASSRARCTSAWTTRCVTPAPTCRATRRRAPSRSGRASRAPS
jgi:hypothetical protein